MPLTNFFTYKIIPGDENHIRAIIQIDVEHPLFAGHFPGNPVTPGVTQIEIVKQILSTVLKKKLMLSEAKDIKYINPILPPQMNDIHLEAKYSFNSGLLNVNCVLSDNDVIFTKIRGTFREE